MRESSLDNCEVETLVPESRRGIDRERFSSRLAELDAPMRARLDAANIRNLGLRYVARLARDGKAHVGLVALPAEDACLHTRLTDNLVQFHSRRYADNPLVVQGPGAGPEVTGAGVFGDVLAIARALGARA